VGGSRRSSLWPPPGCALDSRQLVRARSVRRVRRSASQSAASEGDYALALRDARQAGKVEPGAASPQLQLALVEELQGNVAQALRAARRAARNGPANWSTWLVISRLEAEAGQPALSLGALQRARALNPDSPLFGS
jgi:tetratricopeptide (TPR) repeat protein